MISIPILYENEEILVINKPFSLPVQGGSGITHSVDTVLPEQTGYPVYLVHRLDKDTSGVLVAAKSAVSAAKWTRLIASKSVKKEYEAFCIGTMKKPEGFIDEAIEQRGEEKQARTLYRVINVYSMNMEAGKETLLFSHIALTLDTGRMHQIRIHLAKQNCPIAADDKYGNFAVNRFIKKNPGIKKLMLTAKKISLPLEGGIKIIEAQYPPHMSDLGFSDKMVKLS